MQNLPVNGRQMSQLMLQAPGSQNAGTGTWNDVRFSGRANKQNVIKFDGVEGSAIIDASPGNVDGQIASPFKLQASLENVQEFRVESNNYPAEFGTGTGGQVSVITKSGSNQFRGSVFEYYRDDTLDAPNYFDSTRNADGSVIQELPKSKLNQHQFGGSFGGPIAEGPRVLLRQLRRLPARRRRELRRGRAERGGVGARRAGDCGAASGLHGAGRGAAAGRVDQPRLRHLSAAGLEKVEENAFSAPRRLPREPAVVVLRPRASTTSGTQLRPEGDQRPRRPTSTNKPTNAIFNLQGTLGSGLLNEFKVGYNAPHADDQRRRADGRAASTSAPSRST